MAIMTKFMFRYTCKCPTADFGPYNTLNTALEMMAHIMLERRGRIRHTRKCRCHAWEIDTTIPEMSLKDTLGLASASEGNEGDIRPPSGPRTKRAFATLALPNDESKKQRVFHNLVRHIARM